ncbi:hypothetical protein [Lysinibacter sp. HNR]|nr:hypothetical protein [Lysinibacter sp. HNR]WGD38514.1 hypothetical protein FrondiHNR_06295 [Lysinibacter sp. HNR]
MVVFLCAIEAVVDVDQAGADAGLVVREGFEVDGIGEMGGEEFLAFFL